MKQIQGLHRATDPHWVGNGFFVRSAFTYDDLGRELSPFLLLDYGAPRQFAPTTQRRGVGPHPHRGFETVTVAYQGEIEHRDSTGGGGRIGPGDVQWMTAGNGIVHEEYHSAGFAQKGGTMEMVQLWVNLPARHKTAPAHYQTVLKDQIPTASLPDGAGTVSVIAGSFGGRKGPSNTFTPIELWNVELKASRHAELPLRDGHTAAFLVLRGEVTVDGRTAREGDLVIYSRQGEGIALDANSSAKLFVMSGEPIEEPIVGHGPFVMNTRAEIEQAFEDYSQGRMGELRAT